MASDTDLAGALSETAMTLDALDRMAQCSSGAVGGGAVGGDAVGGRIVGRAAARAGVAFGRRRMRGPRHCLGDSHAARRISGLVTAIKGFTHMDQALVAEPVDLTSSLGHTVAVLNSKAKLKSTAVSVNVEPGLPPVRGFAGELNQIWANLIDNALDAIPDRGRSR